MNKIFRIALITHLAMFTANTSFANELNENVKKQNTKKAAKVEVRKVKKSEDKGETYVEQRGMIRRDATKTLFIPKGQWMLGAQVGWNQ